LRLTERRTSNDERRTPKTCLAAALLAALPAVVRAVQIDPVDMLRSE